MHYILLHGTWSSPFGWHAPGGDFYETLAERCPKGTVGFFLWSGKHSHKARMQAGQELADYIMQFYKPTTPLTIIGHSHGGNVGIIASHYLEQTSYRIKKLYTLGTPVDTKRYAPSMHVIERVYNFFSFGDFVQPVFGIFKREYPPHERIANIAITIDSKSISHSDLHNPIIAQWIPCIHERLAAQDLGNFKRFCSKDALHCNFQTNNHPALTLDEKREQKRILDTRAIEALKSARFPHRSR